MKAFLKIFVALLVSAAVIGGGYLFLSNKFDSEKDEKTKKVVALTQGEFETAVDDACADFDINILKETKPNSDFSNGKEVVAGLEDIQDELDDLIFEFMKIEPGVQDKKNWDLTVNKVSDVRDFVAQLADILNRTVDVKDQLAGAVNQDQILSLQTNANELVVEYQDIETQFVTATSEISKLSRRLNLTSCLVELGS